jgi:hypothetical protein
LKRGKRKVGKRKVKSRTKRLPFLIPLFSFLNAGERKEESWKEESKIAHKAITLPHSSLLLPQFCAGPLDSGPIIIISSSAGVQTG